MWHSRELTHLWTHRMFKVILETAVIRPVTKQVQVDQYCNGRNHANTVRVDYHKQVAD